MAAPGDRFIGAKRDNKGRQKTYTLGQMIASGGEGTVYRTDGGLAIKLYHQPPDALQQGKIATLVRLHRPSLASVAAWPFDILFGPGNAIVGFVMPAIGGTVPLHRLITPMDRRKIVPAATYATLVAIAANLARSVVTCHQAGISIGDMNSQNILVDVRTFVVYLIDCDSYQVHGYTCAVGMEENLPPELQGVTLAKVRRTPNHDAFTLAVLIFNLLVVGRHPFAGSDADTLGEAIKQHAYMLRQPRRWFWQRRHVDLMTRQGLPPSALFTPRIAAMFERAFCPLYLGSRPTALEWMHALEDLLGTLKQCECNADHWYAPSGACCPWCWLESKGVSLFAPTPPLRRRVYYMRRVVWKPWTWWGGAGPFVWRA